MARQQPDGQPEWTVVGVAASDIPAGAVVEADLRNGRCRVAGTGPARPGGEEEPEYLRRAGDLLTPLREAARAAVAARRSGSGSGRAGGRA